MNRCRPSVSLFARRLAKLGHRVCVVDLFGTGDSEGEFGDARWADWSTDIDTVVEYCTGTGTAEYSLLGVRTGALLATADQRRLDNARMVSFWHPVIDGKNYLRQFLRLRLAGGLTEAGRGGESVATLLGWLEDGKTVEVSGYELNPDIASSLLKLSLGDVSPSKSQRIHWFEVQADGGAEASPASRRLVDRWLDIGIDVDVEVVADERCWSSQETVVSAELVDATVRAMAG